MYREPRMLGWRRTVLEMTGQVGPYDLGTCFDVPGELGGAHLILGSEDAFVSWQVVQRVDQLALPIFCKTGPASRQLVYVERGAQVRANILEVTAAHVEQDTGLLTGAGGIALVAAEPALYVWASLENRPEWDGGDDKRHIARYENELSPEIIADVAAAHTVRDRDAIAAGAAWEDVGYALGHARELALWSGGQCDVRIVDQSGALIASNIGATIHRLPVGPFARVQARATLQTPFVLRWTRSNA